MSTFWTAVCAGLLLGGLAQAADPLPSDSVYHLQARFEDQDGRSFVLQQRRGQAQVVSLFYTSCRYVCPLIIDSAKGVEQALTPAQRDRLGFLIVSLDPDRDDTAALQAVAAKRRLDTTHWTLARTDAQSVRQLAALLDVRYRALADGDFNHTSALVLLDADGRRVARTEQLGGSPDPDFLAAVIRTLAPAQ